MRSIHCFAILLLVSWTAFGLTSCKPKPVVAAIPVGAASSAPSGLETKVESFGFAQHLPFDTEAYVSTLNVPKHMAALRATTYFTDVSAYMEDKTPAPSTQSTRLSSKPFPLDALLSEDSFLALGKGATPSLVALRDLMGLVQEAEYRSYMASSPIVTGGESESSSESSAITNVISAILSDPSMLARGSAALEAFEMPPVMFGIKSSAPEKLLAELFDSEQELQAKKTAQTKVFKVSSELGGRFTLIETKGSAYLTPAMVADLLARLPTEPVTEAKALHASMAKVCNTLQQKTLCLAYGIVADHVIIALGGKRPSLEFVRDPRRSLLARPELAFAQPYAQRTLVSLLYMEGQALTALRSPTPVFPILRGLISGLSESPAYEKVVPALQSYLDAFANAERSMNEQQRPSAVGVMWWDKGLHLDTLGGCDPSRLAAAQPLKYTSLLTDPGVLFGIDMQPQPEVAARMRATVESGLSLLYASAQQLIGAGLGGPPIKPMAALIDKQVRPPLLSLYDASKTLSKDALGHEQCWLLDLGGQLAPVPGVATGEVKPGAPMLRVVGVLDVVNRQKVAANWEAMTQVINNTAKANPLLFGERALDPVAEERFGFTHYSYPLPLPSPDLFPCVSVNENALLLGSSKTLNDETAQHLLHVKPSTAPVALSWRLHFAKLRLVMKTFTPLLPKPKAKSEIKSMNQWLEPFEDLYGKAWVEEGATRTSTTWEMHDVLKYE